MGVLEKENNLHNSPLPGISGIPTLPRNTIPKVIGTELHFIADGKIYIGLIREFAGESLLVQCGHSMLRTIQYSQIIGVTECRTICHQFGIEVNIAIHRGENRTLVLCDSHTKENINGVMFYSISKNKEDHDWSNFNYESS